MRNGDRNEKNKHEINYMWQLLKPIMVLVLICSSGIYETSARTMEDVVIGRQKIKGESVDSYEVLLLSVDGDNHNFEKIQIINIQHTTKIPTYLYYHLIGYEKRTLDVASDDLRMFGLFNDEVISMKNDSCVGYNAKFYKAHFDLNKISSFQEKKLVDYIDFMLRGNTNNTGIKPKFCIVGHKLDDCYYLTKTSIAHFSTGWRAKTVCHSDRMANASDVFCKGKKLQTENYWADRNLFTVDFCSTDGNDDNCESVYVTEMGYKTLKLDLICCDTIQLRVVGKTVDKILKICSLSDEDGNRYKIIADELVDILLKISCDKQMNHAYGVYCFNQVYDLYLFDGIIKRKTREELEREREEEEAVRSLEFGIWLF